MTLRLAITGAAGFIGSHLSRVALSEGHTVCALVRPGSSLPRLADIATELEIAPYVLESPTLAAARLAAWRPDVIVHAAWHGLHGPAREAPEQQDRNVEAAVGSLELAAAAGAGHWIGVGSQEEGVVSSAYGAAKRTVASATLLRADHVGIRRSWLRLSAAYGPADDRSRLVPTAACAALARRPGAFTPADQNMDLLYVEDAARAFLAVASGRVSGDLDLASGELVRVRRVIELVAEIAGYEGPLGIGKLPYRPYEPMTHVCDITPLRSATGWEPRVSLRVGLERTVNWYRQHVDACR